MAAQRKQTGRELNVSKGPDHSCDFENHSCLYSLRTEKHLVIISLWSVSLKGASVELKFHVLVLLCNSVENDQLLFCPPSHSPPQKNKFPVQDVLCFDFVFFFFFLRHRGKLINLYRESKYEVTIKGLVFVLKTDPSVLGDCQKVKCKCVSNLSGCRAEQIFHPWVQSWLGYEMVCFSLLLSQQPWGEWLSQLSQVSIPGVTYASFAFPFSM